MNVYDEAHKLSRAIRESDEYKKYVEKQKRFFRTIRIKK